MQRSRIGLTALLFAAVLAWTTVRPRAQTGPAVQTVSPFDVVGFIDAATIDDASNVFSGGTITVSGTTYIVPKNTMLQMPAFALTWQEVFSKAPAPYGPQSGPAKEAQSGLARADVPTPLTTYEVHLQGNRVVSGGTDQSIVGLLFLSQQSLNHGAGFINYIDYTTGDVYVGGAITTPPTPNSGARVVLNDPAGKFGRVRTHDPRFTIDEDNPTVRSETAYPMCVPRFDPATPSTDLLGNPATGDPLCPESNRPRDQATKFPLTIFTMDYSADWVSFGLNNTPPLGDGTNPLLMAPFEIGDYVDYNGTLVKDTTGTSTYISAWGMIANVGIFTQPGSVPTYTAIDVVLLGVGGIPDPNLPQEAVVRTRVEGFSTDPSSTVDLYALDVDSCNASEKWRTPAYANVLVDPGPPPPGAVAPPGKGLGAVAGSFRWRPNADVFALPPTRNVIAVVENQNYVDWFGEPTPAGLEAGQYSAPNFEFIFPENLQPGNAPIPNNFQDFPFLAYGSGPYGGGSGNLGQLAPWPGSVAPVLPVCTPKGAVLSPVADAGLFQSVADTTKVNGVTAPTVVTLNASASHDTNTPPRKLTYKWTQILNGQPVATLKSNPTNPALSTFVVPRPATKPYTLTFMVTVSNGLLSSSATVNVTVSKAAVPPDTLTVTLAQFRAARSRLDVNVTATNADGTPNAGAVLTLVGFGQLGPALAVAPGIAAPPGTFSIRIVGVNPIPTSVTITSSSGGKVTAPVTFR